jgi:hypothetical protein
MMEDVGRSRSRWRRACLAVGALWAVTVVGAAYLLVDQGVTASYQAASADYLARDFATLACLAPAAGTSRAAVLAELRRQNPTELITADDSVVGLDGLRFHFGADGRLRAVTSANAARAGT